MDFEPIQRRTRGHHLREMRKAKANAGAVPYAMNGWHGDGLRLFLLGGFAAADDAFAVTLGHIDPCLGVAVQLGCAAAGVIPGRCAVVLSGFGNPIALFRCESRSWSRLLG